MEMNPSRIVGMSLSVNAEGGVPGAKCGHGDFRLEIDWIKGLRTSDNFTGWSTTWYCVHSKSWCFECYFFRFRMKEWGTCITDILKISLNRHFVVFLMKFMVCRFISYFFSRYKTHVMFVSSFEISDYDSIMNNLFLLLVFIFTRCS